MGNVRRGLPLADIQLHLLNCNLKIKKWAYTLKLMEVLLHVQNLMMKLIKVIKINAVLEIFPTSNIYFSFTDAKNNTSGELINHYPLTILQ